MMRSGGSLPGGYLNTRRNYLIRVVNLTLHYGVRPVLRDVSLEIPTGELVTVLGPNGMGKSTLLAAMAGLLAPQEGYVEFDGVRRRSSPEGELAIRRKVAYLPDSPWLPLTRTGREFLMAVGGLYDHKPSHLMEHAERLLKLFNLTEQADWAMRSYSAGQQKKIALCGALITEAPYLLLDEPFSGGLDPAGILALKRVLERMAACDQRTVVLTTPVPELIETFSERIVIIKEGQVAANDTVAGLKAKAGVDGPLELALEKLMYPETLENIESYFEEEKL
jgi:ABC-type multidrug transport system ATPase subunit